MKKIYLLMAAAALFAGCKDETKLDAANSDSTAVKSSVALPYVAEYSSSFEIGNPEYSATILNGSWKDWENSNLDNMKSWVADTILAFHSDYTVIHGADSLMASWKRNRAKYTSVIDTIHSVIPVYSTDKKENWVLVWAKEINTKADGSKDTVEIMETWRINKDGKADFLSQYDQRKRKQ